MFTELMLKSPFKTQIALFWLLILPVFTDFKYLNRILNNLAITAKYLFFAAKPQFFHIWKILKELENDATESIQRTNCSILCVLSPSFYRIQISQCILEILQLLGSFCLTLVHFLPNWYS